MAYLIKVSEPVLYSVDGVSSERKTEKKFGRKSSWPNLNVVTSICLKNMSKTTKNAMRTIVDPGGIGTGQLPTANTEGYRYTKLIIIMLVVIRRVSHTAPTVNRDLRLNSGLVCLKSLRTIAFYGA